MVKPLGQCDTCVNRYFGLKGMLCEAYPEGIPEKLIMEEVIHDKPYPGDNGVLFKADRSKEDQ